MSGGALVSYLLKKLIKTKHFPIKPKGFIACNKKATLKPCEGKPELNTISTLQLARKFDERTSVIDEY